MVDAELSAALSSIVMVSAAPSNALHIYDVTTRIDRVVALPAVPVAVGVDKTGMKAAVAYDAHVSWVDLQAGVLTTTCAVACDAFDVALSTAGTAYVMPRTDQWISLHAVDLTMCTEKTSNGILWAGSHIGLHPSEMALFAADQGLSPSRIYRCDLTVQPIQCTDSQGSADWGTYDYCGNLWMSADGKRIYSACGATLSLPTSVNSGPATYGGTLSNESFIENLTEAPDAGKIALVPKVPYYPADASVDTVIHVHETAFLGMVGQQSLPPFPLQGGGTTTAHGRFVFTTPTMDAIYVVVQADPSAHAAEDFAIATLSP